MNAILTTFAMIQMLDVFYPETKSLFHHISRLKFQRSVNNLTIAIARIFNIVKLVNNS